MSFLSCLFFKNYNIQRFIVLLLRNSFSCYVFIKLILLFLLFCLLTMACSVNVKSFSFF